LTAALRAVADLPISTSVRPGSLEEIGALLDAGVERVGLSLDAASPVVYRAVKGSDLDNAWAILEAAARRYPGRIATHLIVGLGESERDLVAAIQRAHDLGVTVGLFAFTPVRGTALEHRPPPALAHYRRMQVARHLIVTSARHLGSDRRIFDDEGRLVSFGLEEEELRGLLANGEAFHTSGCLHCNRPYYNERPGGDIYNYARPLTSEEIELAIAAIVQTPGVW
jgi:biotin synthase